jgi:DNA polymerase-3 subunit epsilon
MAPWYQAGPMAPWDCETTGVDVEIDHIVTACVGLLRPASPKWDTAVKSWLIAVDIDIPEAASAIHGITTAYAKEHGQPPAEALDLMAGELALAMRAGFPLVGSNLVYDNTIVDRNLRRYDLPTVEERLGRPIGPCIDIYVLDKWVDPYRPGSRKLTDLCKHYGVRIDGAHDSTFDAMASARIAYVLGQRAQMPDEELHRLYAGRRRPEEIVRAFRTLRRLSLPELHEAQVQWKAEQAESLRSYWMRQANELRHKVHVAVDVAGDDEQAEIARQELAELEARIDSVRTEWPLAPLATQGALIQ